LPALTKSSQEEPLKLIEKAIQVPETILTDGIEFWKNRGCMLDKNGYEDLRFGIFNARIETYNALKQIIAL